jgi:hypothetical protein
MNRTPGLQGPVAASYVAACMAPRTGQQECSVNTALKRHMRMLMNIWPPFLGAGIRVRRLRSDWTEIDVEIARRPNHFEGALREASRPLLHCPSRLSILLATFTPLKPLTYLETPR